MSNAAGIRWHARIRQDKLRRLYENDARDLIDEELIDDVGLTLLLRCQSLLLVNARQVPCPQCRQIFDTGWHWNKRNEAQLIRCPHCQDWECTGRQYRESFCQDALPAENAVRYFREFVAKYPLTSTYREKVLLIDRLIHQFHYAAKWNPDTSLPAEPHPHPHAINGSNLIEGSHDDVLAFLDALTYGNRTEPQIQQTKTAWKATVEVMRHTRRPSRE